jgi:RNA polymerase sigma-70 factor, ECF subfamily
LVIEPSNKSLNRLRSMSEQSLQPVVSVWSEQSAELANLLARIALGDRSSFQSLYRHTSSHLLSVLIRMLRRRAIAEEVLQDVYCSIWTRAASFDSNRGAPMAWMTRIARNAALDLLRRADHVEGESATGEVPDVADDGFDPLETLQRAADARNIRKCMEQLSAPQQQAIALAFYRGLTHSEMAEHLATPIGTIKTWVRRGLQVIKECLGS